MSSKVHTYDTPPLRRAGVFDTTTTSGRDLTHTYQRISWAAIFGGATLVVAVQLLLSLLGAGIGLGTVNTNLGSTPTASSLGIGAGVWWVVSSCVALGLGGYLAAWLAGIEIRFDGVLHGLITWGIAALLTIYLLTSAIGGIIGGGFSALGGIASTAGSGVKEAAKPIAEAAGELSGDVAAASAGISPADQSRSGEHDLAGCPEGDCEQPRHLR